MGVIIAILNVLTQGGSYFYFRGRRSGERRRSFEGIDRSVSERTIFDEVLEEDAIDVSLGFREKESFRESKQRRGRKNREEGEGREGKARRGKGRGGEGGRGKRRREEKSPGERATNKRKGEGKGNGVPLAFPRLDRGQVANEGIGDLSMSMKRLIGVAQSSVSSSGESSDIKDAE